MDLNTTIPALLTQPAVLAEEGGAGKTHVLFKLIAALVVLVLLYFVFLR